VYQSDWSRSPGSSSSSASKPVRRPGPRRLAPWESLATSLLLGLGLALLLDRLDRRVKDPAELEAIFGRPLLGTVRESRALSAETENPERLPPEDAEAFRMLRANLRYFNVDRDNRS